MKKKPITVSELEKNGKDFIIENKQEIMHVFHELANKKNDKIDKICIIRAINFYRDFYINFLAKKPNGNELIEMFLAFDIFSNSESGEKSPFENFVDECEIPDYLMTEYDELPDSCKEIILDNIYVRNQDADYCINCSVGDFIKFADYVNLVSAGYLFNDLIKNYLNNPQIINSNEILNII
jgi:hypothetical protein